MLINRALRRLGYKLVRTSKTGGGYIDATETVKAARAQGLSVREYVESVWNQQGCTERVIEEMRTAGCLVPCDRIVEVGPGTGRYLEFVLQQVSPKRCDIYETADDWATWLASTYAPTVVRQPADGHTFSHTPNQSCGLVHAHGVFVYLSLLHAFEYFQEMVRVCAPQGHICFDFYQAEAFDEPMLMRWLAYPERYPVVLPSSLVESFFAHQGCELVHEFDNPHGHGQSHYVLFRRSGVPLDVEIE